MIHKIFTEWLPLGVILALVVYWAVRLIEAIFYYGLERCIENGGC